ncbi:hypothetical protein RYZ26_05605 [Terasakiella sp. A23]|uniref:glycosyltransferase family protein n=1 Tax=Terasakiella sp. FCG-A23 TaxID=3080561 RepID=UPI002955DFFF|nr:hypothetical protein [Terasakiella sp. A23]MDV7339057.1 hypothetical protein [Terasakiella sp. A23]
MEIDFNKLNFFMTQMAKYGNDNVQNDNRTYWQIVAEDICEGLQHHNEKAIAAAPFTKIGNDLISYASQKQKSPKSIITFNFMPYMTAGDTQFLDVVECPVIGIYLDHPASVLPYVIKNFQNYKNFYHAVMAESHKEILLDYGVAPANIILFPHGGSNVDHRAPAFKDRSQNASFIGRVDDLLSTKEFAQTIGITDNHFIKGIQQLEENLLFHKSDLYKAGKNFLQSIELPFQLDTDWGAAFIKSIDHRVRTKRRMQLFSKLRIKDIHYYGTFSDRFRKLNPHATFHEPINYQQSIEVMKDSKISLSDNIMDEAVIFRPYYAMANKSLVASQFNSVMNVHYSPNVHMLDLDDSKIIKHINHLLETPDDAQNMIEETTTTYENTHTFRSISTPIVNFLATLQK